MSVRVQNARPVQHRREITRAILWSVGLLLVALGVTPIAQGTQTAAPAGQAAGPVPTPPPAPAPAPPSPVQLANQAERQRIMNLLKISAIPPGAVSSSPATYNEAEANPYPNLPDPLTLKNGQKVTTAAVWRSKRRAELLEDFQREIYGRTPKTPKVTWSVVSTATAPTARFRRSPSNCSARSTTPRTPPSASRSKRR